MKIKITIASIFAAALAFFSAGITHAQTDTNCAPQASDLAQIKAVQNDPTLTPAEEVSKELDLRKQLIQKVIDCSKAEINAEKASLSKVSAGSDVASLRDQLQSKLDDGLNFYGIESDKLATTGISGSQAIARELLAWREGSYLPLAGEVNNFILWAENQNLFNTAKIRMDQTQRAVAFLENAGQNADLENALSDAQASFTAASEQNDDAKTALIELLPPDQSLALIKQSLDSLADTYQKFSNVSALINKLISQ